MILTISIVLASSNLANAQTNDPQTDFADRFPFKVDQDQLTGPYDYSYLNHPLTESDRIVVCGSHFCRAGDNQRVRFFGVNLGSGSNFPEQKDAVRIAKRLRRLGVNLVRLHHMDSHIDHDPNRAESILLDGPYPTFNPVAVARLKYFINALSAEGIYVDLNLHVGYLFRPGVDALPAGITSSITGPLDHFYPDMISKEKDYATQLIWALGLKGNPVLAMVEISNEESLLLTWQTGQLASQAQGEYLDYLKNLWNQFCDGTDIPMPMKVDHSETSHQFIRFLAQIEQKYYEQMRDVIISQTDNLVPITGTQMGYGCLLNLNVQQNLGFLDNHVYVDHYVFGKGKDKNKDWRIRNKGVADGSVPYLANAAFMRRSDKPYTITEFNQPWPNTNGSEILPVMAALGSFQDWDALVFFAYSYMQEWDATAPHSFVINGDPGKLANFGQSAKMFRTASIAPATQLVQFTLSNSTIEDSLLSQISGWQISKFFSTKFGASGLLPLQHMVGLLPGDSDNVSQQTPRVSSSDTVVSDTGQLQLDQSGRLFTFIGKDAAGAFGILAANQTTSLGPFSVKNLNNTGQEISVLVTCNGSSSLDSCHQFLISNPGPVLSYNKVGNNFIPQRFVPYPNTQGYWTLAPVPGDSQNVSGGLADGRDQP